MAPLPFGLRESDKFAIIAISGATTKVLTVGALADGSIVAPQIPDELFDSNWQRSLGSLAIESLRQCNIAVIRRASSQNPLVLDDEHEQLFREVADVWWLLQLTGIPDYERAAVLKGSVLNGQSILRAHEDLSNHDFRPAKDARPVTITKERLSHAVALATAWKAIVYDETRFKRFRRGLNILLDGLQEKFGQERLHASVRALEALIVPQIGKTKRQFIDRCHTFALHSPTSATVLRECYELRSDAEHVHDAHRSLAKYDEIERDDIACRRVRQIETLASRVYERVLSTAALTLSFTTDEATADFWNLPENERATLWGVGVDLERIK